MLRVPPWPRRWPRQVQQRFEDRDLGAADTVAVDAREQGGKVEAVGQWQSCMALSWRYEVFARVTAPAGDTTRVAPDSPNSSRPLGTDARTGGTAVPWTAAPRRLLKKSLL